VCIASIPRGDERPEECWGTDEEEGRNKTQLKESQAQSKLNPLSTIVVSCVHAGQSLKGVFYVT